MVFSSEVLRSTCCATINNMGNLQVILCGANDGGGYHWTIGYEGQKLLAMSIDYRTRHEMRQQLIEVLQALQNDDFEVRDAMADPAASKPKQQSEVASVTKAPLSKMVAWQVTSSAGWGILMYAATCPCKKGEVMALFEKQVVVGTSTFEIMRHSPSPIGCDVYSVGPAQAPLPLTLGKQKETNKR